MLEEKIFLQYEHNPGQKPIRIPTFDP
jgi:hypothetical protein